MPVQRETPQTKGTKDAAKSDAESKSSTLKYRVSSIIKSIASGYSRVKNYMFVSQDESIGNEVKGITTDRSQKDEDTKEKRYTSMEASLQRLEIIVYASVAVLIVVIWSMCFGKATPSTTPNFDIDTIKTRLDKIETQLKELQGNMKNEMLELKQEFSFSISTTKQELMNKIPGNEKIKETSVEVVRNEIENSQRIKTMENNINSNNETFATIDTTILNIKEDNKKQQQQFQKSITDNVESIRQSTANEFGKIFGTVNNLEIKLATTEKNVKDFEMKFATQDQLNSMASFIEDAKQQVQQLNVAMDKSKEVLQQYGDTQKIIHQNTFDKDAMIYVLLIIIGGLAGLSFYVCVYKPWQPKESRHSNASEAQKALSAVSDHPVLGNSVCIISFNANRSADYRVLVGSAIEVGTNSMIHLITNHADIPRLPHCRMYIMCVEFSERHVIIEEPGIALGDMKRTTYTAVNKMGGALVILYVNHRGSMRSQDLYSNEIHCVNRQPELQVLEMRNRFISTYDQLNDRQKDAMKQAVKEALKKSF